jgi:hypothetical protein
MNEGGLTPRLVMLEPRRLAAVMAARWMASALGEEPGRTVGWTVRFDRRVSPATRIEVVTEGVLTRRLQSDPALEGIGLVILERKEIFAQVFSQRLSTRAKNLWSFFIDLLVFAFNLFLVIYGMQMTHFSWDIRSESLELPFSYFYVSIPLGALLAIFYLGQRIRKNWAGQGGSEK